MRENVLKALEAWILRVTDENRSATPDELAALPKVAGIVLFGCNEDACLGPGATINMR